MVLVDVQGDPIEILDKLLRPIVDFKENLINGAFGKGKCGCPCRTYWVPKCEVSYVQQCHYDHYQNQVCATVPVPQIRQAKETECQRCRKYSVPTPTTKWAIECNPVYDEKCKTSYPQHCKVEQRCHTLYQTICEDGGYGGHGYSGHGAAGQTCGSVPREHCYPETKCHRTPMTKCRPVQKEKCVKVPREVIVQKEQKQCLPYEISQAEIDAQANVDPCLSQGFDVGAEAVLAQQGVAHVHDAHAHAGHDVVLHQQQAVNGYSVAAPVVDHHHQAPISNGYAVDNQVLQPAVDGYSVGQTQKRNIGSSTIPVHNLYTVDAYTAVPGGVLVNEPLPSNQYYGGRIGERREAPRGSQSNQVNVAVVPDPILGFQPDSQIQYNKKRQLNPANKSKNPFLRKKKQIGEEQKRLRGLEKESFQSKSKPIRFENTNKRSELDEDIETNVINDSVLSQPQEKRIPTKEEIELEKLRFDSDSYKGWKPILYPIEG